VTEYQREAELLAIELSDAVYRLVEAQQGHRKLERWKIWDHCRRGEWREARDIVSREKHRQCRDTHTRDHRHLTWIGSLIDLTTGGNSYVAGGAILCREARDAVVIARCLTQEAYDMRCQQATVHDEHRAADGRLGWDPGSYGEDSIWDQNAHGGARWL
jgi:hypothetical protein